MEFLPASLPSEEILLGVIMLVPMLVAWAAGLFSSPAERADVIRMGNPLLIGSPAVGHDGAGESVLHLSRTQSVADLRDLALGLRNAPVETTAPLLKHFMHSTDPELALFAQSMLQQGRERLQGTHGRLQNHHEPSDPRIAASLLESGLRLASPALTAAGEREGRIRQLAKKADALLATCEHTPRLLAACAHVFLAAGDPGRAESLLNEMPDGWLLRQELEPKIRFALNIRQSADAL